MPDYYSILRSLGGSSGEETQQLPDCAVLNQGWCPPKNLNEQPQPPVKCYVPEGEVFGITPSLLFGPYYFGNDPRDSPADDVPLSM
jgi:hypothetical protein